MFTHDFNAYLVNGLVVNCIHYHDFVWLHQPYNDLFAKDDKTL